MQVHGILCFHIGVQLVNTVYIFSEIESRFVARRERIDTQSHQHPLVQCVAYSAQLFATSPELSRWLQLLSFVLLVLLTRPAIHRQYP